MAWIETTSQHLRTHLHTHVPTHNEESARMKAIRTIILPAAAVLTVGAATAQTQTYDTGNETMTVTKEMCGIIIRQSSNRVYVSPEGTKIIDGQDTYVVTQGGTVSALGGPPPSGIKAEALVHMANKSREACESAVKAMELEESR